MKYFLFIYLFLFNNCESFKQENKITKITFNENDRQFEKSNFAKIWDIQKILENF